MARQIPSLIKAVSRVLPGFTFEAEGRWKGDFSFVQAADTQFGMKGFIDEAPPPIDWSWEVKLAEEAVREVNTMDPKPRFMVVCGDLVNAFPGDSDKPKQLADFHKVFSNLCPEVPLVCICGNHDIGDTPTETTITEFKKDFGDDFFAFWVGGTRFLVLNSQLYKDASACPQTKDEQDKWLDKELANPNNVEAKHIIVLQHIPWFIHNCDEPEDWSNIDVTERSRVLKRLHDAGVTKVFAGHYHRNGGGVCKETGIELVVTSAVGVQMGDDNHGFRIVKVTENAIEHKYHNLSCVPPEEKEPTAGDK